MFRFAAKIFYVIDVRNLNSRNPTNERVNKIIFQKARLYFSPILFLHAHFSHHLLTDKNYLFTIQTQAEKLSSSLDETSDMNYA